ncbi:MAG: MoaD/ThiS family protein [Bacteroidia bacterium]|nr:MoaD/ThiS family protein [Bacteroidia bacterium]
MSYTVRFFGKIADLTGSAQTQMPFATGLQELILELQKQYPALQGQTYLVTVNRQVRDIEGGLNPGDEIALLPPFSGG